MAGSTGTCEQVVRRRVGGADQPDTVVVQLVHESDEAPCLVSRLRMRSNWLLDSRVESI